MLNDKQLGALLQDICYAESLNLPGVGKHNWVVASQILQNSQSPPPIWIWLLVKLLETLIPAVLDYLKQKFGADWPTTTMTKISKGQLPWQQ